MENTYTTAFAWKPETHTDTKCVQVLLKKAADICQDDFSLVRDLEVVHDLEVAKPTNKLSMHIC